MNNTLETKFRKLIKEDDVKLTFQIFAIGFVSNIGIWLYKVGATDTNINGLFYYTSDWEISLGRWLIPIMDKFRFYFCFPILSSIISLLYFSIATVISLNVLDIKDKILKIIVGGMFIVTPCVGFSLTFFYCSDSYSMAMILASLFVYLIKKDFSLKNSFLAFFCIIGLFALYQAYISYAATLGLSFLIICLIKQDSFEYIIKKALTCLSVLYWVQ